MWQSIDSSMWTIIESNLAIIVACMPAFRKSLLRFFPFLLSKVRKTAGTGGTSGAGGSRNNNNCHGHSHSHTNARSGFFSTNKSRHLQSSDDNETGSPTHGVPPRKERTWSVDGSSDSADDYASDDKKNQIKVKTMMGESTPANGDAYSMDFLAENGRKSTTAIV